MPSSWPAAGLDHFWREMSSKTINVAACPTMSKRGGGKGAAAAGCAPAAFPRYFELPDLIFSLHWFAPASFLSFSDTVCRPVDEGEYAGISLNGEADPEWGQLDEEGLAAEIDKYRGAIRSAVRCAFEEHASHAH